MNFLRNNKGFSLVEVVVGSAIFLVIALAAYGAYNSVFQLATLNQTKILAVQLANEQFEIARNMTYDDIGIINGIPAGTLEGTKVLQRGGIDFTVTTIVRNIDLTSDGTIGGDPNDLTPADNKLVQITISCDTCRDFKPFAVSGQIAPKNVEAVSTNGSLRIQVLNANGTGVPNASVRIEMNATTTPIIINDETNNDGILQIIDLPPATLAYEIYVSKQGFSSDQTYAPTPENPEPLKPHATVAAQSLTQISFIIDQVSSMTIKSVTPTCEAVPNLNFNMSGARLVGPEIPKYSENLSTNSVGVLDINDIEWDSYTIKSLDESYDISGVNPLNPINVNSDSHQEAQLIVVPRSPRSLLVTVKDSATNLPLSGALVRLYDGNGFDETKITGQGFLNQVDWSGGAGQEQLIDHLEYWSDDGGVETSLLPGDIVLKGIFDEYSPNGMLESSTFNTGTSSNFYSLFWNPGFQPPLAGENSTRLQFATSPSSTPSTWNFFGPDGTPSSYYTSPDSPINIVHNGDRYARYRVYLSTNTATVTPTVSDVSFTYTSGCVPPGQVIFSGISNGTYTLEVSKTDYVTNLNDDLIVENDWQEAQVILGP